MTTAPTWGEVEEFLRIDGWRKITKRERGGTRSRHVFFEKVLDDGRVLQTHISQSRQKTMSPGRFGSVIREQLEVSREQFWEAISSKSPVERPTEVDERPVEHEAWVVRVLVGELHVTPKDVAALSPEEGQKLVEDHWSKPT